MPADDIPPMLDQLQRRIPYYQMYRDYYRGHHRLAFATNTFQEAFRSVLTNNLSGNLRENLCPAVVAAPAERLGIVGWEGAGAQAASDVWTSERLSARANRIHRESLREGDAYVLVWNDAAGRRMVWPHRAESMTVRYAADAYDRIDLAAKMWTAGEKVRVNLYYADRLERWVSRKEIRSGADSKPDQWEPLADDDGPAEIRHDFGRVPVEHFAAGAELEDFGASILDDVIPLQDALNKELANTIIASEAFALPLRALLGYTPQTDPTTGLPVLMDFDPKRDQFLAFPGSTQLIQLPAADIGKLHDSRDRYAEAIARVTGTPLRYFVQSAAGQQPSGASQRMGEVRLTSRVEDAQQDFTPKWQGLMSLLGVEDAEPHWADAAPVPESEELDNGAKLIAIGGSERAALKRAGYDDDAIDEMAAEKAAEQASVGQAAVDAFRAGQDPGGFLR